MNDNEKEKDDSKFWVLIPAYQPDEKLIKLAEELSQTGAFSRIIVVNDGSSEDRDSIFSELKKTPRLTVLSHAVNRGKGQALKTGLNYYLLESGPENLGIVTCDADGQHLTSDIIKVAEAGAEKGVFTLGVRNFGKSVPFRSWLGNSVTKLLFALFTGHFVSDTQTGLRYIPRSQAPFFMKVPYDRFDYEFAALVNATSELKGNVREVPIETVYLDKNASSHYRSFRDSITICAVFLRYFGLSVSTALLDFVTFGVFYYLWHRLLLAFVAARIISVLYNFNFARSWVFKAKNHLLKQFAKYISLVLFNMSIAYAFTYLISHFFGGYVILAKIIAEGTLFLFSFIILRRFILVKDKPDIT
ncbi:MAG: bifunctional glycosyltransferase family 2/GtrA family protein [Deltaproteobacteria bacterium]|jgi:glycosyltransferase involved in cell wall biosynthesis|nr:bifunctional glycosyltransferase family 2/GtrA family protein [Deltaproteobacteria bacterium]